MFSGCTVPPDGKPVWKKQPFGSNNQEACPNTGKSSLLKLINDGTHRAVQSTLARWLTFPLRSLTPSDSQSPTLLLLFLSSELLLVLQSLPLYWQILILLPKFPLTFIKTPKGIPLSIAQLMTILVLAWMVFVII